MPSATVTPLKAVSGPALKSGAVTRLQSLGRSLESALPAAFERFFSAADDQLFELAEKPTAESAAYFDQLRVLRKQKSQALHQLRRDLMAWIDLGGLATETKATDDKPSIDALDLIDDDSLERTLAIDSFARRVVEVSGHEWLAYQARMGVITGDPALKDTETPYYPAALGEAVMAALDAAQMPLKTAIMLMRRFEETVLPVVQGFYEQANRQLISDNILPNLDVTERRTPAQQAQALDTVRQKLAGLTQEGVTPIGAGPVPTGPVPMSGPANGAPGVMVDPALWQSMLHTFHQAQVAPAPAATQMSELKQWTHQQAQVATQQVAGTPEAGTVSMVAMLFEYILDDDTLSAHMKQLLARMQIPMIKVALIDKDFFTDTQHSARTLLNRMARAASGWSPSDDVSDDPLLQGMEGIVSTLNQDFEDDLTIFDDLLDELNQLVEANEAEVEHTLSTLAESEQAALEIHQQADRSPAFLEALLAGSEVPEVIGEFLSTHWLSLMSRLFKQQGESKTWKTTARVARELVWSLQPTVQTTQSARFQAVMPKVQTALLEGMTALKLGEDQRRSVLAALENHYALHGQGVDAAFWDAQEKFEAFESQVEVAEAVVEAPLPLPVEEPSVASETLKTADLSFYVDQVATLSVDQWFDIELKEGEVVRGRLSVIVGDGQKYVFTDLHGDKLAERSAIGLAMGLLNDQFRLIDDDPLFDRMIDTLVANMSSDGSGLSQ